MYFDKFEFYMIKSLNSCIESIEFNEDKDLKLISLNVFDALLDTLVEYRKHKD